MTNCSSRPPSFVTDFPVTNYGGTKSIVISTVSWVGGKNPFMGWAYVATAILFVVLGIAGTVRHLMSPRYVRCSSYQTVDRPILYVPQKTGRHEPFVVESARRRESYSACRAMRSGPLGHFRLQSSDERLLSL